MKMRLLVSIPLAVAAGGWIMAQTPAMPPAKPTPEEITAERDHYMKEVQAAIAGRENEPAGAVFKNIRWFKDLPAGRLPLVMNLGFGRALGVSCTHCHVPGEWDRDDKPQKQVARDMAELVGRINRDLLPAIKHLDSKTPTVNCTTCHRGHVKPALNLPGQ